MSVIIKAEGLTKSYVGKTSTTMALNGVELAINKGESVAIVGKSGSGKSTLIHILSLLDKKSSGGLYINGKSVSDYKDKQLDKIRNETFGFVFQQFFLNPRISVLENVAMPLKIAGVKKSERHKCARKVLQAVDLSDKAHNRGTDLSGGQKQRVCIARALVNSPEVIFADEPTGNLDSTTGRMVEKMLFNLNKQHNITLILVTHDHELAAKCDRQIMIKDGYIIEG